MAQQFLSNQIITLKMQVFIYLRQTYYQKDQVIDMILIVDDTYKFHEENMNTDNHSHYSFYTKRLPVGVTNAINNGGSCIYFNPLIPIKTFKNQYDPSAKDLRKIKYGVISTENAVNDLISWNAFAFAGRLQKPILTFINEQENQEVHLANEKNRDMALNQAIFMNFHQQKNVHLMDLYTDLCSLSYRGDIRMRFKMENPNKVKNVVLGSFDLLNEVYQPRLKNLVNDGILEQVDSEMFKMKASTTNVQYLFDRIPDRLKTDMKKSVVQLSLRELQEDVQKNLESVVYKTSKEMILSGLYSTNPLKNLAYVYSKYQKGRGKK
ncbi:UNKNOWN [Stylonychia lemnae]|uniref:Phosphatidate cytidylyltransferase, mitochondrial n=1 Tax=Stylonychia lemnae TaxID=5949 RepID=A0A078AFX1_STYLE|nr:UNKNOWN [Stylonychia lemnae]|eukprot:CDW81185.1 UNKNOWN [Stylonychia lemnae]